MPTLRPLVPVLLGLILAFPGSWAPLARAEEPSSAPGPAPTIFPLAEVRPGLKGYGLTVKRGTKVERFEVEVVDVMRRFVVKQDVILVRCLGEDFADHRVAQGMSGSPIFLDGRLVGALAYTWSWARHALGGVTPIETMLAEGRRPEEGRPTGALPPTALRAAEAGKPAAGLPSDLRPIGTPLCVSGFSPTARAALAADLAPEGYLVAAGGGGVAGPGVPGGAGGAWVDAGAPLEPGSAITVDLMRGDFTACALGTCTWIEGTRVFAFGHPFQTLGETRLPLSLGYVYGIMSSDELSFKLGGPLRAIGTLVHDRPSGITGFTDRTAPMVPFDLTFKNPVTRREEAFHFEITPNTILFQKLLISAVQDGFARAEATLGPNTKRFTMGVKLAGLDAWSYEDVIGGFDAGFQRVLIGLVDKVLNHESQRGVFEWVRLDVEVEHTDRRATIDSVTTSVEEVRPGQTIDVEVRLEPREKGPVHVEHLAVRIPADAPAGDWSFAVLPGDMVPGDVASPKDLADLPKMYAAFYRPTEIIAVLPTGRVDLDLDGRLVRSVPLSSLPRLARSPGGTEGNLKPVTEKVRRDVPFVVMGQRTVTLRVVR